MTPAMILELLSGLIQAAPSVLALFQKAQAGGVVTQTDVSAVLSQYGVSRAVFVAAIAAAEHPQTATLPSPTKP